MLGLSLARDFRASYNITANGNFKHGTSNPALVEADFSVRKKLSNARRLLLEHREAERVPPGKDTKISTAWNSMLIRALADAGFYFNRPEWLSVPAKPLTLSGIHLSLRMPDLFN